MGSLESHLAQMILRNLSYLKVRDYSLNISYALFVFSFGSQNAQFTVKVELSPARNVSASI